jgi:ATP-binding cassette, subfamily B, bacterial PglK
MIRKFFDLVRRCLRLALPYGRGKFVWIVVVMLLNGLMQMVGVVSIFPFLALAANPRLFRESEIGAALLSHLPPLTDRELLIYTGTATIGFLFAANLLTLVSEIIRNRYAHGFGHWLRARLIGDIVARPYG